MTEKKRVLIVGDSMSGSIPAAILEMADRANIEIEVVSPEKAGEIMPRRPSIKDLPIYPLHLHPSGPVLSGQERRRARRKNQRKRKK